MKKHFGLVGLSMLMCFGVLFGLTSCSDDDGGGRGSDVDGLVFEIVTDETAGNPVLLVSGETYTVAYHGEGVKEIAVDGQAEGWQVSVDETAGNITVAAPPAETDASRTYTLRLTVTGLDGTSVTTDGIDFYRATFDGTGGTFVLNEGNMTTENGSLDYITPEGYYVNDAYKRVNGTELGNVAQDMCFYDGKIYIITQNGGENPVGTSFENDGMLVVADGKTLEKVKSFTADELAWLDWPTHIAVIDEQHVYIRDNKGVWHLNMDDGSLTFVTGSDGALKKQFAVTGGEVYFVKNGLLAALKKVDQATDTSSNVSSMAFWSATPMINSFLGIAPAEDGSLWIMGTSSSDEAREGIVSIGKLDIANAKLVQNVLSATPNGDYCSSFAAYGNTVYYANGTTVYRAVFNPEGGQDPADEPLTDLYSLDANAGLLYNGVGVNPVTGHVFVNSLKGFGNMYTTNSVWEFDFDASLDTPVNKYDNYTNFPAGFFFNK